MNWSLKINVVNIEINNEVLSWWPIIKIGSFKFVLRLNIPRTIWEIKRKETDKRYFQFLVKKLLLLIEEAIINKIEKVIGKANNLWVSRIKHCLLKDKQICADQVDESLTPMKDWIKVSTRGTNNNNLRKVNRSLNSLFSRFWFIEIVVIRSRNAIKRWPVTVYESSRFITVKAPKDPWTITRESSNE